MSRSDIGNADVLRLGVKIQARKYEVFVKPGGATKMVVKAG